MPTLEVLSILFAVAGVFGLISYRLRLPITIGTMLFTVLTSFFVMGAAHFAPSIHQQVTAIVWGLDFKLLILRALLPLLLFASAFLIDMEQLAREKLSISLLAVVGTTLSVFLVATVMYWIGRGYINWVECLIFGALISPTDPIAVLEMLRRTGVPRPIRAQLEGESLFNDGVGAVFFLALLSYAQGNSITPWHLVGIVLLESGGAILLGIALAWVASQFMRQVGAYQVEILFTIALALGGYALASHWDLSAPLESVVSGIALRYFNHKLPVGYISHDSVDGFWKVIDEVQNSVLFVLLGLVAIVIPLTSATFGVGLAAIFTVNLVRLACVAGILMLVKLVQPKHRSSIMGITWGGLRGGLSIALALSVPAEFGRSWILGATYMVVVFSVLIQGGSLDLMLRKRHRKRVAAEFPAK